MINKLHLAMIELYSGDAKRIQHFCKVHSYAKIIAETENVDEKCLFMLEAAALTHDIGIHLCEEKYGKCNGKLQEKEGPALAKKLLEELGFDCDVSERVQYLIAHHHTYDNIDGIDYQILVEADFLVNIMEDGLSKEAALKVYHRIFKTECGKKICKEVVNQVSKNKLELGLKKKSKVAIGVCLTIIAVITLEKQLQKGLNDYLTGIHNREGFKKKVESFICDDTSRGTLLICDLDNFKRINDSLGHPEGDKVLQLFANCIKRQFRNSDVLGRLGGDEFVVFLPNQMEITVLRRKLDAVMEDVNMLFSVYKKYELGVSIGAGMLSHEINDYELLYGVADSALYVAKRMGKNRYFINSEGIMCMKKTCDHCRIHCPRREALEKIVKSEKRYAKLSWTSHAAVTEMWRDVVRKSNI